MTQSWIDHKKIKKAKLAIINQLIEGGHEDRLLDLVGQAPEGRTRHQAQDLHHQHATVSVPGGRVKGQTGWLDGPDLVHGAPRREDDDPQGVHYHGPDTICPIRDCPLTTR